MRKKIIISVSSDLCTDQRVQKVSMSCFEHGYDVLLLGRRLKNSQKISFPYSHKRFNLFFNHSVLFYAELNIRLFFFLTFSKCDIMLSNDTDTLLANYYASKFRRKKLVFDAHELFPEVPELINRPRVKTVWKSIENHIFPKLEATYTVSQSIADYYNEKYGIKMQVIRNMPYLESISSTQRTPYKTDRKTIIYQGALNIGRGLEWIIHAMPYIENALLVIVGEGDIKDKLQALTHTLNLSNRVSFVGKVLPDKLKEYTSSADLGLCLLENRGLSYYYSLPNRIFDYIQAGIPVLATDFPEIRNIVGKYKTGILINQYEPEYIAQVVNKILSEGFSTNHFQKLAADFCWENEEKTLLSIINGINIS